MWVLWNLTSFRLETVLVSVQDRFTVCAKRTVGLEIVLDTPDGTPRSRGSSESSVRLEIVILMQDRCTVCVERTMSWEIVWDTPDRLPRDVGHIESLIFPFGDSVSVSAR
jgi:hypothetical protein